MNVWNTIGLRVEKKDQLLNVRFSKISESDPNKWFSVKIKIEDDHKIKGMFSGCAHGTLQGTPIFKLKLR